MKTRWPAFTPSRTVTGVCLLLRDTWWMCCSPCTYMCVGVCACACVCVYVHVCSCVLVLCNRDNNNIAIAIQRQLILTLARVRQSLCVTSAQTMSTPSVAQAPGLVAALVAALVGARTPFAPCQVWFNWQVDGRVNTTYLILTRLSSMRVFRDLFNLHFFPLLFSKIVIWPTYVKYWVFSDNNIQGQLAVESPLIDPLQIQKTV